MTPRSSAWARTRSCTGQRLAGFVQDEGGVTAHFTDTVGRAQLLATVRGEVLICADGIHSAGRRRFYPDEGRPSWAGVVMWRGAVEWPVWEDGETMAIAGGLGAQAGALSDRAGARAAVS
jgi:2-polyprenyl-6-methoxyphenol hydroxylase-like FAD-dependent oxidoreductase